MSSTAALATEWPHYVIPEVGQSVVERVGYYSATFALRRYDSVQRTAALKAGQISDTTIDFVCFDERMNKAARVLGMDALFANSRRA